MLKHVKGDLLALAEAGEFDTIVQGCNCFNTMGSGIAKQIRESYSMAYEADTKTTRGDIRKLGTWTSAFTGKFFIINAYTQFGFNGPGESSDVFEYESFYLILKKLSHIYGDKNFGFPYIGMGLAGGDKIQIIGMLEWFAEEVERRGGTVTLVEFG